VIVESSSNATGPGGIVGYDDHHQGLYLQRSHVHQDRTVIEPSPDGQVFIRTRSARQ
jgi:hypothetical protein